MPGETRTLCCRLEGPDGRPLSDTSFVPSDTLVGDVVAPDALYQTDEDGCVYVTVTSRAGHGMEFDAGDSLLSADVVSAGDCHGLGNHSLVAQLTPHEQEVARAFLSYENESSLSSYPKCDAHVGDRSQTIDASVSAGVDSTVQTGGGGSPREPAEAGTRTVIDSDDAGATSSRSTTAHDDVALTSKSTQLEVPRGGLVDARSVRRTENCGSVVGSGTIGTKPTAATRPPTDPVDGAHLPGAPVGGTTLDDLVVLEGEHDSSQGGGECGDFDASKSAAASRKPQAESPIGCWC